MVGAATAWMTSCIRGCYSDHVGICLTAGFWGPGHSRLTTQLNKKIVSIDVLLAYQLWIELASMTLTLNLWLHSLKACPGRKLHSEGTRFPPEKGFFFSWVAVGAILSSSNIFFCSWIFQKTKLGSYHWQRGILIAAVSFLLNQSIGVWVVAELFVCREQGKQGNST